MHYYCEKRTLWPETEEGLKIKQAGSIRILFLDSGLGSYTGCTGILYIHFDTRQIFKCTLCPDRSYGVFK